MLERIEIEYSGRTNWNKNHLCTHLLESLGCFFYLCHDGKMEFWLESPSVLLPAMLAQHFGSRERAGSKWPMLDGWLCKFPTKRPLCLRCNTSSPRLWPLSKRHCMHSFSCVYVWKCSLSVQQNKCRPTSNGSGEKTEPAEVTSTESPGSAQNAKESTTRNERNNVDEDEQLLIALNAKTLSKVVVKLLVDGHETYFQYVPAKWVVWRQAPGDGKRIKM